MKADRRGEGGFFEAMVAMMIISVALTALFGHMALWQVGAQSSEDVIAPFLEIKPRLEDGSLELPGAIALMEELLSEPGVQAVALEIELTGMEGENSWRLLLGETGDAAPSSWRATSLLEASGGRTLPASYLLTVWHA